MRTNAKMYKTFRIEKHEWYAYHKYHIDKVIAIAFTRYDFVGSITDGGEAVKLRLF